MFSVSKIIIHVFAGSDTEDNVKENDGSTVSEVEWLSPKNSNNLQSVSGI